MPTVLEQESHRCETGFLNRLMKKLLCAITLSFCSGAGWAQAGWDSTYRPDIFRPQVELFRTFPVSKNDFIFLGDSITFWGDWAELLGRPHVKNRGIPGDISFGVLERLDELIKGHPAKIFLLIGINDMARNIPDNVILHNITRVITNIKTGSPSTKIYIQSILPTNDHFNKLVSHYHKDDHIRQLNTSLKGMAPRGGFVYVDLFTPMADEEGKLKKEFTWDGVHLTVRGYSEWVSILKKGRYLDR